LGGEFSIYEGLMETIAHGATLKSNSAPGLVGASLIDRRRNLPDRGWFVMRR